jgi:ankyrin repeat protein
VNRPFDLNSALALVLCALIFTGCIAPKVIEYKPFHNGGFKARARSAQLQDASAPDLLGGGFLLIGYMDLRQNIRSCFEDGACVAHSTAPPVVDDLLQEAARRGGDIVTLLDERDVRERTSKSECTSFYASTMMVDGKPIVTTTCGNYKYTNGTLEAKTRLALVWRHEPDMAVDDANAVAIEKALQTLEAVADSSAKATPDKRSASTPNWDAPSHDKESPLASEENQRIFAAIRYNDSFAMKSMARDGVLRKWSDEEGRSPLMVALVYDRKNSALTLAGIDPEIDRKDKEGKNVLMYAAMLGDKPLFERLLKAGYNGKAEGPNSTPLLFYAISNPDTAIFDSLVAAGADLRKQDASGNTALMMAAEFGRARLVRKLLAQGFAVEQRNKFGQTALMMAARGDQPEIAQLLIKSGANARNADQDKQTVLHYAAHFGNVDGIKALIAGGAVVNAEDKEGRTALIEAIASRQWTAADMLIGHGAALATKQVTAGRICSILLDEDQIGLLRRYTAAFPELRKQLATDPEWLHFAAKEGGAAGVSYLLDLGAKIDARSNDSISPLMTAATHGNAGTVRALLERKADATRRDSRNRTAKQAAKQLKFDEVVAVMQEFAIAD